MLIAAIIFGALSIVVSTWLALAQLRYYAAYLVREFRQQAALGRAMDEYLSDRYDERNENARPERGGRHA